MISSTTSMIYTTIVLLALAAVSVYSNSVPTNIPYGSCGPPFNETVSLIEANEVTMEGCDGSMETCPLTRGRNQTLSMVFTTTQELCGVTNMLHGRFSTRLKIPYKPRPSKCETCDNESGECSATRNLFPGHFYKYIFTFHCNRNFPKVKVVVEHKLLDCNGHVVHCITIPTQISDPPAE